MDIQIYRARRVSMFVTLKRKIVYKLYKFKQRCIIKGKAMILVCKGEDFYYYSYRSGQLYMLSPETYVDLVIKDCGETSWININGRAEECERF